MSNRLITGVGIVVIAIWAISMIVDMIPQANYEPPVAIYPALMLVLGSMFGVNIVRQKNEADK